MTAEASSLQYLSVTRHRWKVRKGRQTEGVVLVTGMAGAAFSTHRTGKDGNHQASERGLQEVWEGILKRARARAWTVLSLGVVGDESG